MSTASLILGIVSIITGIINPALTIVGLPCGIAGAILGAISKKDPQAPGIAKTGMICSIAGAVLCLIILISIGIIESNRHGLYF